MLKKVLKLSATAFLWAATAFAQQSPATYQLPDESVQQIFERDRHYDMLEYLAPDNEHLLIPIRQEFSTLERMSRKTYRLAMLELNPHANREWRLSTHGIGGLKVYSLSRRESWPIQLPEGILVSDMTFSPDSRQIAFLAHLEAGTQVWVADVASGEARALSQAAVMVTLAGRPQRGRPVDAPSRLLQWTPQGSLLTLLVPQGRGPEPQQPAIPDGPLVRRTRDKATPTPTYPFLLRTPHDHALFRYYTTAQLAELRPGQPPRNIGDPAMYLEFSLSPDGRHILAERLEEPFSDMINYQGFPRRLEVMDLDGTVLETIREVPLHEGGTRGSRNRLMADRPREVSWRPDGKGLSLLWQEPKPEADQGQDSEDSQPDAPRKDRLMLLAPPFDLDAAQTLSSQEKKRFSQVLYSAEGRYAIAQLSGDNDSGQSRTSIVAFDLSASPPAQFVVAEDFDPDDPLATPGEVLTRRSSNGIERAVFSSDGKAAYLKGSGYHEDFKPRPFVDRVEIESGSSQRVFEGAAEMFEEPLAPLDDDLNRMVVSRESKAIFPESYLWARDGSMDKLTDNQDPFPEVASARRVDFEFTRRDGLKIQGRISLPPGYQPGVRLPAVFWTYPREFKSFKEYKRASIERRNHNAFPHLNYRNASEIWLTQGYAVVEPDIPIIGEGNSYNNNYIAHLVDSMYAAIRKVDELGYVDVDRLGHGGHSYGAFATANILAHTPFFKAGIAGDGAYNRTLTPMSFQNERRFIWQAQDVYLEMSPFFSADHLDTPLLMYHGADDNNTGTFLIQSERFLQALTGLGKTAALYIYPFESHGPRAKATYLDLWARWLEWFDRYVKAEESEAPTGE